MASWTFRDRDGLVHVFPTRVLAVRFARAHGAGGVDVERSNAPAECRWCGEDLEALTGIPTSAGVRRDDGGPHAECTPCREGREWPPPGWKRSDA